MALYLESETNAKAIGTLVTVPDRDVNKLAYYLYCGTTACGVDIINEDLVNFRNVHLLPQKRQDAIFLLAYHTFDLDTLINKTIFYDAFNSNKLIPRGRMNEFYSLERVQTVLAVQDSVMIGGRQTQVQKIMVFNKNWLTKNYIDPLKRNEPRIRRIVAAMEQERANTQALTGLLELLTTNESNQSKHCDHCQGSDGVCDCENGCPAKAGSQCQVVHKTVTCDLCMTQGIKGTRYQCKECFNFDLCDYCYEHGDHAMGTHAFSRMPRVGSTPVYVQPKRTLTASAPTTPLRPPTNAPVVTPDDNRTKYEPDIPIALAVESPHFRPGQTVRITGLVSKPEWNGRSASVKRDMGDGRVVVTFLDDGKNMTVKAANLEVVNEISIPVNTIVEIFGVAMDVTLNGELGVVVNVSNAYRPDRVQVQLLNNESRVLSLKPENLRIVEDVAS